MVVFHLEFDEARHDRIDVVLTPYFHFRDLPVAYDIVARHRAYWFADGGVGGTMGSSAATSVGKSSVTTCQTMSSSTPR